MSDCVARVENGEDELENLEMSCNHGSRDRAGFRALEARARCEENKTSQNSQTGRAVQKENKIDIPLCAVKTVRVFSREKGGDREESRKNEK